MSMEDGPTPVSLLPPGLSHVQLLELYRALSRGEAAAYLMRRARPADEATEPQLFPPLAALGAAFPLRRGEAGEGDLLGLGIRSTMAGIVHGGTPESLFAPLLHGPGSSPGRDSTPDWTDLPGGLLGPDAPPGVLLGVMAGITLAFRLRGEDRAGLFLGGGAESAAGAWHEAINFAAVQRCPLVLVVLNAPSPPGPSASRIPRGASPPASRGVPYGIFSVRLNSRDLPGILVEVATALQRARGGEGVTLLEITSTSESPGSPSDPYPLALREELRALGPEMLQQVDAIDAASREEMEEAWLRVTEGGFPRGRRLSRPPFRRPIPRVSASRGP